MVGGFGSEEFRAKVTVGDTVGVTTLAGLTDLEGRVGGEEALVVGWATLDFLSASGVECGSRGRLAVVCSRGSGGLGGLFTCGLSEGGGHVSYLGLARTV